MENASKALIIAGAILLSILIISLGIMVYNNSKNTVNSANLSQQEIATFNSQWEAYVGSNKTASEVRTLISAVIASNAAETNSGSGRTVTINNGTPSGSTLSSYYVSSTTYTIEATYDETGSGLIKNLNIK
jgi:hypothetical protein